MVKVIQQKIASMRIAQETEFKAWKPSPVSPCLSQTSRAVLLRSSCSNMDRGLGFRVPGVLDFKGGTYFCCMVK